MLDAGDPTYVPLFPHPDESAAMVPEVSSRGQKPIG